MKATLLFILLSVPAIIFAQDPWKNIYSAPAWQARDKWQRADELIAMLNISSGDRVADVGCHEGYMTFKLAKEVGASGIVYAVDIQQTKLDKVSERARKNSISQIRVIKGEEDNPGLPANSLDAVVILDTYHEMDEHAKILQHIKVSLKKGGRLLICEPIADDRKTLSRSEQKRKHELALTYAESDLKAAGLKIVFLKDNFIDRSKEKGDKMWVIVAEKI